MTASIVETEGFGLLFPFGSAVIPQGVTTVDIVLSDGSRHPVDVP